MPNLDISPTPNPNSLKFTLQGKVFIESGMESFGSLEEAAGHHLGEPLLRVPGVVNVFILPQFLTVTKAMDADWDALLPEIERMIERSLGS